MALTNGQVTFTLSHGEERVLTVPQSARLVVEETVPEGYTPSTESADYPLDDDGADNRFTLNSIKTDGTVTFINAKGADLTIDAADVINSITAPTTRDESLKKVSVYTIDGVLVRRGIKADEARTGLGKGIYIIGGKKVIIK